MSTTTFSGSLSGKRRADLVEIAEALGLDTDVKMVELKEVIQNHLDQNEATLSTSPQFKGLYVRRRSHNTNDQNNESDSETTGGEAKSVIRTARKSVSRAVDRVQATIDAAGIPLPDSPMVHRVAEVANDVAAQAVDAANAAVVVATNASQALVPTEETQRHIRKYWNNASRQVVKYTNKGQERVDVAVTPVREFLSSPQNLIIAFLSIELVHLLLTSSQSYNHTIFFPPAAGLSGSFDSLLSGLFFWAPKMQFTVRVPEWANWNSTSQLWGAVSWWVMGTVVPALAGSSIISLTQHTKHAGVTTRQQAQAAQAKQTFDPLVFALLRFVLLLWPLTTAAPTAMVDSLEMSGNLQGRALAAGLMAALVTAQHASASS